MVKLKPLYKQVVVVNGALSNIGKEIVSLTTELGGKVFMIDSDGPALQDIHDRLKRKRYDSAFSVANLSEENQVQAATDNCIKTFSTIDTWVNATPESFWAIVNGCNVAVPNLNCDGGVVINVGSHSSNRETAEDGIKGFTDALRKNLIRNNSQIKLSLVTLNQANVVARVVVKCAEHPKKEIYSGLSFMDRINYRNENFTKKSLLASGLGSVALLGGLTFFMMKKFRIL